VFRQGLFGHHGHAFATGNGCQGAEQLRGTVADIRDQPLGGEQLGNQFPGAGSGEDERVLAQRLELNGRLFAQRVTDGEQGDHLVFHQGKGVEALLRQHHESHVDPPLFQPLQYLSVRAFVDLHLDSRMGQPVTGQQRRQQFGRGGWPKRTDTQGPAFHAPGIGGLLAQGIRQAEHGPGPQQQLCADIRQFHLALVPAQQLDAQFLLQPLEGMGNRRLADPQAQGCTGKAAQFGDLGKHFQLSQGHELLLILR